MWATGTLGTPGRDQSFSQGGLPRGCCWGAVLTHRPPSAMALQRGWMVAEDGERGEQN